MAMHLPARVLAYYWEKSTLHPALWTWSIGQHWHNLKLCGGRSLGGEASSTVCFVSSLTGGGGGVCVCVCVLCCQLLKKASQASWATSEILIVTKSVFNVKKTVLRK